MAVGSGRRKPVDPHADTHMQTVCVSLGGLLGGSRKREQNLQWRQHCSHLHKSLEWVLERGQKRNCVGMRTKLAVLRGTPALYWLKRMIAVERKVKDRNLQSAQASNGDAALKLWAQAQKRRKCWLEELNLGSYQMCVYSSKCMTQSNRCH